MLRRRTMMGKSGGGILPSGYTAYDWVQADSTTGYPHIRIGLYPNRSTEWEFEGDFARTADFPAAWTSRSIFNKDNHANFDSNYALRKHANSVNKICGNYNSRDNSGSYSILPNVAINVGEWHHFVLGAADNITYGGSLAIDDTIATYDSATRGNAANKELVLLYNENGLGYPCRFAEFKATFEGALVADLIPAMRDADSVVGFYDVVRNTFYAPTTEGVTLLCGYGFDNFNA